MSSPSLMNREHWSVASTVHLQMRALPKTPLMGWRHLLPSRQAGMPNVSNLRHTAYVTSGRAALLAALRQLNLPVGSGVLVPTYHCPTMVAPVLQAGLTPIFFPIGHDGLPMLESLERVEIEKARAIFVAHYFGLPKGLHSVRKWCDDYGIVLVEDCAHSYFGLAGNRPVGAWGDYATASLSKFFPVAEGGLLASAHRRLSHLGLASPGWRAQTKGALDVVEVAHQHGHLPGLGHLLAPLFWLKNQRKSFAPIASATSSVEILGSRADSMMINCDMGRTGNEISVASNVLHSILPTGAIVRQRRANFAVLLSGLEDAVGARSLVTGLPDAAAPYVFPLWVDGLERSEAVYAAIRAVRLPVFRWDQVWPGTPQYAHDAGSQWSHQVLQLLCHQDLAEAELRQVCAQLRHILQAH